MLKTAEDEFNIQLQLVYSVMFNEENVESKKNNNDFRMIKECLEFLRQASINPKFNNDYKSPQKEEEKKDP